MFKWFWLGLLIANIVIWIVITIGGGNAGIHSVGAVACLACWRTETNREDIEALKRKVNDT